MKLINQIIHNYWANITLDIALITSGTWITGQDSILMFETGEFWTRMAGVLVIIVGAFGLGLDVAFRSVKDMLHKAMIRFEFTGTE